MSKSFFQAFGTRKLLGSSLFRLLAVQTHEIMFKDLVSKCGYQSNVDGFFQTLISNIFTKKKQLTFDGITINGITIPPLYLYHLLEAILPGNRLYAINNIDDLEKKAHVFVNYSEKCNRSWINSPFACPTM